MKKLILPIFASIATTSISSQLLLNINNQSVNNQPTLANSVLSNNKFLNQDTAIKLNYARQIFQKYTKEFSRHKSDFSSFYQRFEEKWTKINKLEVIPKDSIEKQELLKVATDYLESAIKQVDNIIAFKSKHPALQPKALKENSFDELKQDVQQHLDELNPNLSNVDAKLSYILVLKEELKFPKINDMLTTIYEHNNKKFLAFNLPKDIILLADFNKRTMTDIEENKALEEAKSIFENFSKDYNDYQETLKNVKKNFNVFWKEDLKYSDLKKLSLEDKEKCIVLAQNYLTEINLKWNNISSLKNIHEALLPNEIRVLTIEKITNIQKEISDALDQISSTHKNINSKLTYILQKIANFNKIGEDLLANMKLIADHNHFKWTNFDE